VSASGPYEDERQTSAAARHITSLPPGTGAWGTASHRLLCEALSDAGVELGAFDHSIVQWICGYEPSTVAVLASLITRAHQAGKAAGRP
jgi:hypothetical protein